MVILIKVIL